MGEHEQLNERVTNLFRETLAAGGWTPLAGLKEQIPASVVAARRSLTGTVALQDTEDPDATCRGWLAEAALTALLQSGDYQVRGPYASREVRLHGSPEEAIRPTAPTAPEAQPTGPAVLIDEEFASLIPPPTAAELSQLEENLLADKVCLDALKVWKGHNVLIDGHTRYRLCLKHKIQYHVTEVELTDRKAVIGWIVNTQLGRRNLNPTQVSYLRGKHYNDAKQSHGGRRVATESSPQSENLKTSSAIAHATGVSPATVLRDGVFADAVDAVAEVAGPSARREILSGQAKLGRQEVVELASSDPERLEEAIEEALNSGKTRRRRNAAGDPKANQTTVTLPRDPELLAAGVIASLGAEEARKVHKAIGKLLKGDRTSL